MSHETEPLADAVTIEYKFAKFAQMRGKIERAIAGYRQVLQLQPDHEAAYLALGELLLAHEPPSAAVALYQQALSVNPHESRFHKGLVNALVRENGIDAAFDFYQLSPIGTAEIMLEPHDVLACVVVRNEILRLPYFLDYYRRQGTHKFFIIDNASHDGTAEYLQAQPDVFLWHSPLSFKTANFGAAWFEVLMRKYGINHWCLTVDADEIFYYPQCEQKSLPQLCAELDEQQKKAYNAVLLDMYSDKPLNETTYFAGQNFLKVCPFFDRKFYHRVYAEAGPYKNQDCYFGGMRERVFGQSGAYYLSKVPLLKYTAATIFAGGQHWTNTPPEDISDERGCLLHFKYFDFFAGYVAKEVQRQEHYFNALQYRQYQQKLNDAPTLCFYNAQESIRFQNSKLLIDLGIMHSEEIQKPLEIVFPPVSSVAAHRKRPFWSIKITTYNRTEYLKEALESVLSATADCEEAEIEVINDAGEDPLQAQIKALVDEIGAGKIKFYALPQNLGHPYIFNFCIDRANGCWTHLLHDDDLIKPDFYRSLQAGIRAAPEAGAAFCRFAYLHENGTERHIAEPERETAGIIEDWIERIAVRCRIQGPAIVVKRETYEKLGGYCREAESAFDWEMWKRIAAFFPVWYEPQSLAAFREHPAALSFDLIRSGGQIADSRKTIAISRAYLPTVRRNFLSQLAARRLALFAVERAAAELAANDKEAAAANLREALKCERSAAVQNAVETVLQKYDLAHTFIG